MKKSLIALAAVAAVAAAQAQESSVTFYGIADVAVGHVEHSLSVDPSFPASVNPVSAVKTSVPNSVNGMFNGGISPSRWGVKGVEDLGGGMKAFFTLESGINLPTGQLSNAGAALARNSGAPAGTGTASANSSIDGQLFNRQAFVGLSDKDLGSIQFGRNYASIFDIVVKYDPVQAAQLFSPLGFSGTIGGGGGVSEDTRMDGSIKYGNKIDKFNFGGFVKLGGVAGSNKTQSGYGVSVGYEEETFGVQFAYQGFYDALKAGTSAIVGDVNLTNYDTKAWMLAGRYTVEGFNLKAGWERYTLSKPSNSLNGNVGVVGNYYGLTVGNPNTVDFAKADQSTDVIWIGGDYNVASNLNLSAGFYDQRANASSDLGQHDGNIYSASVLLDYSLSKRTDVYGGLMYSKYSGDQYNPPVATVYSHNYITAVGIRHRF
ncbi:MAG: porin [Burkholderiaceae bacterium]|nr:porin [Roseateles sp.]MBV8469270.1 porin [Burkholderiaceae bacterium]